MEAMEKEPTKIVINQGFMPLKLVTPVYHLSTSYLYKLRYERKLFHYTLGSKTFIEVEELEALIRSGKKIN
jgi:hypothetical protein